MRCPACGKAECVDDPAFRDGVYCPVCKWFGTELCFVRCSYGKTKL